MTGAAPAVVAPAGLSAAEVAARIATVRSALVRNRTDGAIVRVMSPTYGGVRESSERLVAFVQAMSPILDDHLPQ